MNSQRSFEESQSVMKGEEVTDTDQQAGLVESGDGEVEAIATCYAALGPLPVLAQVRAMDWLKSRLESDERAQRTAVEPNE